MTTEPRRPGDALRAILAGRRMSQVRLARQTGLTTKHLNHICMGRVRITAAMAVRFEAALQIPAEYWLNLQQAHDLWELRGEVR